MKGRGFWTAILLLLPALACTDTNRIPADVIPKEKMENILWDLMLADRYSEQYLVPDSSIRDQKRASFRLYAEVFAVHGVSKEKFISSYKFYLDHPDITSQLFDSLSQQANKRRTDMFKSTDVQ